MKLFFTLVFTVLLTSVGLSQFTGSWQGVLIQNNEDGTTSNYAVWMFLKKEGDKIIGSFRSERAGTSYFKVSNVVGSIEGNTVMFKEETIKTHYTEQGFTWCLIQSKLNYDEKKEKLKGTYVSKTNGCLGGEIVLLKTNRDFNMGEVMLVENVESLEVIKNAVLGRQNIVGKQFILKDVIFQSAKFKITSVSFSYLNEIATLLKDNEGIKIHLKGHTDSDGDDENNFVLSQKRAKSVADYLLKKGISKNRIFFEGFGESRPLFNNNSEENKLLNRRVELQIISQ